MTSEAYTIWILLCAIFVYIMQIGFALLECGLLDVRNAAGIIIKNALNLCVGAIVYLLGGCFIMWGSSPILPSFPEAVSKLSNGASPYAWILYHTAFAVTSAVICSGAIAGRMRLSSYLWLTAFMTGILYPLVGRYIWNVEVASAGVVDLAGSLVVHSVGGAASFAAVLLVGNREERRPAHNAPLAMSGAFFLWIGWFGFNMGSVDGSIIGWWNIAGWVGLNTLISGAAGGFVTFLFSKRQGLPVLTTTINGILGGLVAITASAHLSNPVLSMVVGGIAASIILWWAKNEARRGFISLNFDDAVGAIPVHCLCGMLGGLMVIIGGLMKWNLPGMPVHLDTWPPATDPKGVTVFWLPQFLAVMVVPVVAFVLTAIFLFILKSLTKTLTVTKQTQILGYDREELYENAYEMDIMPLAHHEFLSLFERALSTKDKKKFSFKDDAQMQEAGEKPHGAPFSLRLSLWLRGIGQNLETLTRSYHGGRHFREEIQPIVEAIQFSIQDLNSYVYFKDPQLKQKAFEKHYAEIEEGLRKLVGLLRQQAEIESAMFDVLATIREHMKTAVSSATTEVMSSASTAATEIVSRIEKDQKNLDARFEELWQKVEENTKGLRTLRDAYLK